ncbi:MAG: carboxyl transferase [Lachnospiraceae bacterium]|nr:carboxyl transferase [Lachnospiraceae bacterium]
MSTTSNVSAGKRIEALLDDNSFVEIGSLVTARNTDFNLTKKETPADGVITGYGLINNNPVYVYSQDAAVLGGSVGEMHAKKIVRLYDMAMKMGAPIIGLIDSAGLRLEEATDALNAFGEIYAKQVMASGVIPQISAVFGNCGGGLSVMTGLADFTFMADDGHLFVNSPNTIDGNIINKCDSSGVEFQSAEAGNVDFSGDETTVLEKIRELVSMIPANNEENMSYEECTDDLNRGCECIDTLSGDTALALASISDNHVFFELKKEYAKDMVTGFIRLNGTTVGAVANRTERYDEEMNKVEEFDAVLTAKGCEKAAAFVEFCDAFEIPVLTLTNAKGFQTTMCQEKKMVKAAAKLTYAFANATVPKVNVIVKEAFGTAYSIMNSKALGADMVFAWPDTKVGMMSGDSAVRIIYADEISKADSANAFIGEKAAEYESLQLSVNSAAGRGYIDSIIEPVDTRKYVIGAYEMLFTKREDRPAKKHGTV